LYFNNYSVLIIYDNLSTVSGLQLSDTPTDSLMHQDYEDQNYIILEAYSTIQQLENKISTLETNINESKIENIKLLCENLELKDKLQNLHNELENATQQKLEKNF